MWSRRTALWQSRPMIYEHTDYRNYLRARLAESISQNSSYSLRAFAKRLGLAPSMLSSVLSGKRNLSRENALRIAHDLDLNQKESEYFCTLVELEAAKSPEARHQLVCRLSGLNSRQTVHDLSVDYYKIICDWYHSPILEMAGLLSFEYTPEALAKKLGISPFEAQAAIERLERIGLIEKDESGLYQKTHDTVVTQALQPNEALRRFHRQMLEKAIESLTTQTPQEKKIGSETVAFHPDQLPEVEELMEEFFTKLVALAKRNPQPTEVYHFGVQFFRVTRKG
jgi:uncharacterized protein (TIGR02147 family)